MKPGRPIPRDVIEQKGADHRSRRTFGHDALDELFALLSLADEVVPVAEAARRKDSVERIIGMRHDVDHDLEAAVAFARVEAANGYRSSYYMLHTDWYYRASRSGAPSAYLLDACAEIASLGHEVALHNNVVAAALQTGQRPSTVLSRELAYLREAGHDVVGTVAHGDSLCHQVGFVNSEVFVECARPRIGEPDRELSWRETEDAEQRVVQLRPRPMAAYDLEYEAGYVGHSQYLSDSGGVWHRPIEDAHAEYAERGGFLQILAHPIWWALDGEAHRVESRERVMSSDTYVKNSKLRASGE